MLEEIGHAFGRPAPGLTRAAREALMRYQWPGNICELRNALEGAAIRCDGSAIDEGHLALHATDKRSTTPEGCAVAFDLRSLERDTILRVLKECGGTKRRRRSGWD
jgi:two-component system, NtrC family, response regulator HydG